MDRSGADFMVDVIKSLSFEYVASNPGSPFSGPRHRHTGAAINYYFQGSGHSVVEGAKYPWKASDLMLSAPGWAVHNRAALDEDVYELTIQESPLNIWMGSLL
jgi:gentisate 1,2-dioxygenase